MILSVVRWCLIVLFTHTVAWVMNVRSGVFWYGMEGFVSIFRRFSLSIGSALRLVVMCVLLLGLTSCFVGKHAFEMSRNYRPVYNPGGHLFEEDEDFVRSYELYKKRREDLQNSSDRVVHKKRLTDAEKRKVVGKLRRHGVKVAATESKGDMVNNEGIDLSRVRGARFIDVDLNEIAKLKAKGRTKDDAAKADEQHVEDKGIGGKEESSREEDAGPQLHDGDVSGQEAGSTTVVDSEGQQHADEDGLEQSTAYVEGGDFFTEEEDEDQESAEMRVLGPSTAEYEGEDAFVEEDEDQQHEDVSEPELDVADDEGEEDFLTEGDEDQPYAGEDFLQDEEEDGDAVNTGADAGSTLTTSGNGVENSRSSKGYLGSYFSSNCSGTGGGFYFSIDDECCDGVGEEVNCDSDEGYIFGNR